MSLPIEIENIKSEISRTIGEFGADLLDIYFKRFGNRSTVTFIVDKQGGVTLDDCVQINKRLGQMFDELSEGDNAPIQGSYFLEVNSPGLDRPLRDARDYARAVGATLRVTVKTDNGHVDVRIGRLASVEQDFIELSEKTGNTRIEFHSIVKAVKEIQFGK